MLREAPRRSTLQAFDQDQRRPVWFCPPRNVSYDQDQTQRYRPSPRCRLPIIRKERLSFRMCTIGWRVSRTRQSAKRPQKSFGGAGHLAYDRGLAMSRPSPRLVTTRFTEFLAAKVLHVVPPAAGHGVAATAVDGRAAYGARLGNRV